MGCKTKTSFPGSKGRVMLKTLITMGTSEDLGLEKARKLIRSWHQRVLLPKGNAIHDQKKMEEMLPWWSW